MSSKNAGFHLIRKKRGFTLIELLVVVAIIGTLSSVVLASLNDARARAQDARRLQDMQQLRIAFEHFYQDYDRYPGTPDGIDTSGEVIGAGYSIDDALRPYIDPVPIDPRYDGGFGQTSERPVAGALYFYSYDPQHRINDPGICDEAHFDNGAYTLTTHPERFGSVFGFNYAEQMTNLPKDTCIGTNTNLDDADFNTALRPMAP